MKFHRFFLFSQPASQRFSITDAAVVGQIQKVLRLKTGDQFIVADGKRTESTVQIIAVKKNALEVEVVKTERNANEPKISATLYLAILKRENFELSVQKAVESGIVRVVPLQTERTVKLAFRRERLEKIAREAAEQSGRGIVPELGDPLKLDAALGQAKKSGKVYFFDPGGAAMLPDRKALQRSVFVGPEGGWSPEELASARSMGAEVVSLGALTLRAETAAVIASYLAVNG